MSKQCEHCLDELPLKSFDVGSEICLSCEDIIHKEALAFSAKVRDTNARTAEMKETYEANKEKANSDRTIKPAPVRPYPWGPKRAKSNG